MCLLVFQRFGQIDDSDGLEGTLLDTNTASDAQLFGDVRGLGGGRHLDAHLSHAHDWAVALALLLALARLALLRLHDGDPVVLVLVIVLALLRFLLGRHALPPSDEWLPLPRKAATESRV